MWSAACRLWGAVRERAGRQNDWAVGRRRPLAAAPDEARGVCAALPLCSLRPSCTRGSLAASAAHSLPARQPIRTRQAPPLAALVVHVPRGLLTGQLCPSFPTRATRAASPTHNPAPHTLQGQHHYTGLESGPVSAVGSSKSASRASVGGGVSDTCAIGVCNKAGRVTNVPALVARRGIYSAAHIP